MSILACLSQNISFQPEPGEPCQQFWRLVEQEKVKLVVMLCQDLPGLGQHLPHVGHTRHGDFEVELLGVDHNR